MKKHKLKNYTWHEGRLFTEEWIIDSFEEAKSLAYNRGPHAFKIYDIESDELVYTENLVSGNSIPEYA